MPTSLAPLPDDPTKAQEMQHLCDFVRMLPRDSYLRSYLAGAEEFARAAMSNDMHADLLNDLHHHKNRLHEDNRNAEKELDKKRAEIAQLRSESARLESRARRIAEDAADAVRAMNTLHAGLSQLVNAAKQLDAANAPNSIRKAV